MASLPQSHLSCLLSMRLLSQKILEYHSADFAAKKHSAKIAELVSKSAAADSGSKQVADLFLAFKIIISMLNERYKVRAVLADTNFSTFNLEREQDKSPLNANLKSWQDMHAMTTDDMVAELIKYFDVTEEVLVPATDALASFRGRPFFLLRQLPEALPCPV